MSREFAQQHEFIPKDAAPGFYGFSGITNLGTWPIKVGEKTVNQQVMLVESAFFPIVLGRSFMEKRGVRTDPLDQTYVTFMDSMFPFFCTCRHCLTLSLYSWRGGAHGFGCRQRR